MGCGTSKGVVDQPVAPYRYVVPDNAKYGTLFSQAPMPIYAENHSRVLEYLHNSIHFKDIDENEWESFLNRNPKVVQECVRRVEVLDVNEALLSLFKAKDKEQMLFGLRHLTNEKSLDSFKRKLVAIRRGDLVTAWDTVIVNLEGEVRNVSVHWSVPPGNENALTSVLITLIDITEARRSKEEIKRHEQKFHGLFDKAPIGIYTEDHSEVYQYLRDVVQFKNITNWTEYIDEHIEVVEECVKRVVVLDINEALLQLFKAKDKNQLLTGLRQVMSMEKSLESFKQKLIAMHQGEKAKAWETVVVNLEGEVRDVSVHWCVPPGSEDSSLSNVLITLVDITESKRRDRKAKHFENKFNNIFLQSPMPIYTEDHSEVYRYLDEVIQFKRITDFASYLKDNPDVVQQCVKHVKIVEVNDSMLKLFGASNTTVLIEGLRTLHNTQSLESFQQKLIAIHQGVNVKAWDTVIVTIHGEVREVSVHWSVPHECRDFSSVLITLIELSPHSKALLNHKKELHNWHSHSLPDLGSRVLE
eukprot:GCRY01002112.1.p1 GENE.GCRY01002112.1~~GCRY01002112.1.p1  ORF type:complete len:528 (-),score=42.76 GCRY01002112.1:291-1874(-)